MVNKPMVLRVDKARDSEGADSWCGDGGYTTGARAGGRSGVRFPPPPLLNRSESHEVGASHLRGFQEGSKTGPERAGQRSPVDCDQGCPRDCERGASPTTTTRATAPSSPDCC